MEEIKRYLAFQYRDYDAFGGMDDLVIHCDTLEDCYNALEESLMEDYQYAQDKEGYRDDELENTSAHIYDLVRCEKVWVREGKTIIKTPE